jgi:hypothetical protein
MNNQLWKELKTKELKNLISSRKGRLVRKQLTALNPFGIEIGVMSKVKKVAILFCYTFISNNIFTLLITFPEDSIIQ